MTAHPTTPPARLVVSVPDEAYAAGLAAVEGIEVVAWDARKTHPRAEDVRLVVMPYMQSVRPAHALAGLPALEVVQLQSAGYDDYVGAVPEGVTLCNAAGVHDSSTAELTLLITLAALRDLSEFVAAQAESRWVPLREHAALADRRVLVVGYGHVGRAIAARFAAFEVSLAAVASRPRAGDHLVDEVHGLDELPALAERADVMVLAVPLDGSTRGLVDARLLAHLPDGALVVNVARGPVVVTDDLVAECASGRLRAALDVTDPEPLPRGHPLWTTPGVLITPHVGGATEAMRPRALRLVTSQVEALRDGRPVANVVDPAPRRGGPAT